MGRNLFLPLFVSSFLFLVSFFISSSFPVISEPAVFLPILLVSLAALYRFLGRDSASVFAISSLAYLALGGLEHISTLFLHMSFISFALYFLWDGRGRLISGCGGLPKRLGLGLAIFIFMVIASMVANLFFYISGITDQAKVAQVVTSLPLYIVLMSFTLGPISEELFFRAFLVPHAGVLVSSILFALTHFAYGSVAEFVGAFFLGLVLAAAYARLKDPLPGMVAHALFNLFSMAIIFWVF